MSYTSMISGRIYVDNSGTVTLDDFCRILQEFVDNEPEGVKMYRDPGQHDNSLSFTMHINGKFRKFIIISKSLPLTIQCIDGEGDPDYI